MAASIDAFDFLGENSISLVHGMCEFQLSMSFKNIRMICIFLQLIFTAKSPTPGEIFCKPPGEVRVNDTDKWIKAAHKKIFNRVENEEAFDFCNIKEKAAEKYLAAEIATDDSNENLVSCSSFEHHPTYFSLIHQYDLFCSREALIALTQSFHLLGVLIGGVIAFNMLKS